MAIDVGSLIVRIEANLKNFESGMNKVGGMVESAGKSLNDFGKNMSKYVSAPIMAIGAAAFMAAKDISGATKIIRKETGATGEDLKDLTKDFKAVFKDVPADAKTTATALGSINTRTGQTGEALRGLTAQMLKLSKLTGSDITPLVAGVTRVFGDWSISTKNQSAAMDYLWKVSQQTGIGIDALTQKVVQFGAPLRQMGFTFEQAAAMIGKWEKEGVNAELVLGSLRIGLVRFAKAGEDAPKALQEAIVKIKEMGSSAQANAAAVELFGARAGSCKSLRTWRHVSKNPLNCRNTLIA